MEVIPLGGAHFKSVSVLDIKEELLQLKCFVAAYLIV